MLNPDDPIAQTGAYIHDGVKLYRVLAYESVGPRVKVEDCADFDTNGTPKQMWLSAKTVERAITLVKAAPPRKANV